MSIFQDMDMTQFIAQQVSFIGALIGFLYGINKVWVEKKPMYVKIVVMAVGCAMLARLFNVSVLLTEGAIRDDFSVGNLGVGGTFLGLLSANFGQIDGLVDDHTDAMKKYRIIPVFGSAVVAAAIIPLMRSGLSTGCKICYVIGILIMGMAVYYHVKHLIIPDVSFGITDSIKSYNLLALVYAMLSIGEMIAFAFSYRILYMVCGLLMGIVITLLMIALERGVSRWKA